MASKQAVSEKESPPFLDENMSYSSHKGEEYNAASYGSKLQPPGLAPGYTMVHEDCCRARYKPSTAPKGSPYHICLNKATCRSIYGGTDHSVLRGGHRADPGVYEGFFGKGGKLLCAKAGTRTTARAIELMAHESRESDRAHAATLPVRASSPFLPSVFAAADQRTSDSEGEAERAITESSGAVPTAKDTMLLDLLASLCQKIDNLSTNIGKEDNGQRVHDNQRDRQKTNPGILRPPKMTRRTKGTEAISSVAKKHERATRDHGSRREYEETEYVEEYDEDLDEILTRVKGSDESVGEEWNDRNPDYAEGGHRSSRSKGWVPKDEMVMKWSESEEEERPRQYRSRTNPNPKRNKTSKKKDSSRPRLYAIACGRGGGSIHGVISCGLGR